MIEIKNLRNLKTNNPWDVRVDRRSVLGNPFVLKNEAERDTVCDQYKKYFREKLQRDTAFRNEVDRLFVLYKAYGKISLFCWCSPKRCHAETIKRFVEKTEADLNKNGVLPYGYQSETGNEMKHSINPQCGVCLNANNYQLYFRNQAITKPSYCPVCGNKLEYESD